MRTCHSYFKEQTFSGMPNVAVCMECHQDFLKDHPDEEDAEGEGLLAEDGWPGDDRPDGVSQSRNVLMEPYRYNVAAFCLKPSEVLVLDANLIGRRMEEDPGQGWRS